MLPGEDLAKMKDERREEAEARAAATPAESDSISGTTGASRASQDSRATAAVDPQHDPKQPMQAKIDGLRAQLRPMEESLSRLKRQLDLSSGEGKRLLAQSKKKIKQWRYVRGGMITADTIWQGIETLPRREHRQGTVRYRDVPDDRAVAAYEAHRQRHGALSREYADALARKRSIEGEITNLGLLMTTSD